jgi:hypothetical protein
MEKFGARYLPHYLIVFWSHLENGNGLRANKFDLRQFTVDYIRPWHGTLRANPTGWRIAKVNCVVRNSCDGQR